MGATGSLSGRSGNSMRAFSTVPEGCHNQAQSRRESAVQRFAAEVMHAAVQGPLLVKGDGGQSVTWQEMAEADLMPGDVPVRVSHSTINYKDGLALTGKAPVVRRWPMIPGIDFAGTVVSSTHAEFKAGDEVILNGWGVGETHYGGYAQMARVKRRLADQEARGFHGRRDDGHRHRRLHGHAVRARARAARRARRPADRCW